MNPYEGNDPDEISSLFTSSFYKLTVFRHLLKRSSFPTNFVPVPKGTLSSDVGDHRPILITLLLSKVLEKFMAGNHTF